MKTPSYFFTALLIILFASCNESNEKSYHEVETKLDVVIPILSTSGDLKSESEQLNKEIPFSGTNDYELRQMVNNSTQFLNIHRITPLDGSVLVISDMNEEHEINSLKFQWGYKSEMDGDYNMMESLDLLSLNHTSINGSLQFDFDEIGKQLISEINHPNVMLRFSITGECNQNFSSIANLQIPVIIESEVLTPRFELF